MGNYDAEVRVSTKVDTSQMQRLQLQIDKAVQKVDALTKKYDELKNRRIPTEAYAELESKLASAKAELTSLIAQEEKFESTGTTVGGAWDSLIQKEADAQLKIEAIQAEMQKLVATGKAFTIGANPAEINNAANELSRAKSELRMLVTKQSELGAKSNKVSDGLKRIGAVGKKAFGEMNGQIRKSGGLLSTFASRLKGIALSLLVFNWVSRGFNVMVAGIKEGFKNLVQYSDEYNRSISSLQSANAQLKNSFAAAFAPIIQMVIPYLVQLIGYVTSAINAVAQFIAILSGKTTWTKATAVQKNYAASLNGTAAAAKKAAGALARFDDLDVLSKTNTDEGSGGGAGGIDPGSMFEEVPVGKISDFWKKLLDALKKGDWYEIGKTIGEKLKEALDSIPWDEIKEKARVLGKNLADLINGFVEVEGLGFSIGRTLAEALNTALEFLYSFASELHFESIGKFIADSINGFFKTFDFPLLAETINAWVQGIWRMIKTAIKETDWKSVFKGIWDFVSNIDIETVTLIIGAFALKYASKLLTSGVLKQILKEKFGELLAGAGISAGVGTIGTALFAIEVVLVATQFAKDFMEWKKNIDNLGSDEGRKKTAEDNAANPYIDTSKYSQKYKEAIDEVREYAKENPANPYIETSEFSQKYKEAIDEVKMHAEENPANPYVETSEYSQNIEEMKTKWNELEEIVKSWFSEETWQELLQNAQEGMSTKWEEIKQWWSETAFVAWWEETVAPWFTVEKWYELIEGVQEGFDQLWNEICEWWSGTALVTWWDEHISPWFTIEKWYTLAQGIYTGISNKWTELVAWWKVNIATWWNVHVAPWFTVEKWRTLGENMKNGIFNGFKGLTNKVIDILNEVIEALEGMLNKAITGINSLLTMLGNSKLGEMVGFDFTLGNVAFGRIPHLATGAVIRGGNPFMAVLGDQKFGQTNVEAPLSTIEDAMRNVLSEKPAYDGPTEAEITLDGEAIGRLVLPYLMKEWERGGYSLDSL